MAARKSRRKKTKTEKKVAAAFGELKRNEPAAVGRARRKFGAKRALKVGRAIGLSKARKAGAHIPKPPKSRGKRR